MLKVSGVRFVENNIHGIWNTFEAYALSADMSYEDYCHLHTKVGVSSAKVSEEGYAHLDLFFNLELEKDETKCFPHT